MISYITDLKKEIPNLVICGDYNICHEAIDIHNPVQSKKVSGFCQKKGWFDGFLGFIDSPFLNKEPDNYTWWTVVPTARPSNKVANRLLFRARP
jgi:exodeoxyribonuclease-3